ncbi:hypothetical protein [Celerinatantimonas yamalensis]|uniref:Uncharacterized protein n=1 Tax=Celerinatantimonas yamalensis TaxID=559956 RepID=A0ABW9G282_9GAMM
MSPSHKERRRGPDKLQRWLSLLTIICWFIFLGALIIFHYARPQIDYGYLEFKGIDIRAHWDATYLPWYLRLLWLCIIVTLVDLLLRLPRHRRRSDHHIYNLIVLLLISAGALGSYYVGLFG